MFQGAITKEQFSVNWEKSKSKFYKMAFCYTKNEHDAWEVLSESTYRAYCNRKQLREEKFFDTWMCKIIINEAIRFLRKGKNQVEFSEDYIQDTKPASKDAISQLEDQLDVYQMMDLLCPEEKTIIILKYYEEKTFWEIAELLQLSESTIKSKLYRALNKMRKGEA